MGIEVRELDKTGNTGGSGTKTKHSLQSLTDQYSNLGYTLAILKGTKLYRNKSIITYIIALDENTKALESIYSRREEIEVLKRNKVNTTKFKFIPWDILKISSGQLTGSNMNMLNDTNEYSCYIKI